MVRHFLKMVFHIIHQQVRQVMWQFLACLGLVMTLPIEQAIVNFRDGDGFYADETALMPAMVISIFLAGLIACSNVQADFKEKRYVFWRSKPVNTKCFIVLKFFTGMFVAMLIMILPLVFYFVTIAVSGIEPLVPLEKIFMIVVAFLGVMVYSLCFACNMLIRKTARSWLVALTLACFALLIPFILPVTLRQSERDIGGFVFDLLFIISAVVSVVAFVFAILAADRNWHLRTNLKGLMWVVAAMLFSLMLLFSTQIANIKVLDTKEAEVTFVWTNALSKVGDRVLLVGTGFVDADNGKIALQKKFGIEDFSPRFNFDEVKKAEQKGMIVKIEGDKPNTIFQKVYYELGDKLFSLELAGYYDGSNQRHDSKRDYKNLYLVRKEIGSGSPAAASVLDLTEMLTIDPKRQIRDITAVMRKFGEKLVIGLNTTISYTADEEETIRDTRHYLAGGKYFKRNGKNTFSVADLSDPAKLTLVGKNFQSPNPRFYYTIDSKEHPISLVPIKGASLQDRIKFSIDLYLSLSRDRYRRKFFEYSNVEVNDEEIVFAYFSHNDTIVKCVVTRWDEETIYYKTTAIRNATFLERITLDIGFGLGHSFVQDGRLYVINNHDLCVFDISGDEIRKMGHFVNKNNVLTGIHVLDDGNILTARYWAKGQFNKEGDRQVKCNLVLLKKP